MTHWFVFLHQFGWFFSVPCRSPTNVKNTTGIYHNKKMWYPSRDTLQILTLQLTRRLAVSRMIAQHDLHLFSFLWWLSKCCNKHTYRNKTTVCCSQATAHWAFRCLVNNWLKKSWWFVVRSHLGCLLTHIFARWDGCEPLGSVSEEEHITCNSLALLLPLWASHSHLCH